VLVESGFAIRRVCSIALKRSSASRFWLACPPSRRISSAWCRRSGLSRGGTAFFNCGEDLVFLGFDFFSPRFFLAGIIYFWLEMFPFGEEIRFGRSSSRSYEPETDLILSRENHCLESKNVSDAAKSVGQPWKGD
jgi:hypothetical protein